MQTPNGIHYIDVGISPTPPIAGSEVCVTISTPLPSTSLSARVTVGSTIVHNGPPPSSNEICFETSEGDQGKAVLASVSSAPGAGLTAFGAAQDLLE